MSEHCREQRPLLCENASEEELFSPQYYQRTRPRNYRSRARNNLKGAAAILTRWPDHWSSFLVYWWIGIGMISLSTFVIYNSLFAFSTLPPSVNLKSTSANKHNKYEKSSVKTLPEVYIHVFVNEFEDIDFNQYMPYIEILANTFLEFRFNVILLNNDTNFAWMSAEENNELALNALWTKGKNIVRKATSNHNINIEQVTLSTYMDNSPLRKYWRTLPHQLLEFLVRTVSIWDKGGIAFNPDILTPNFQYNIYIEKLQKVLNKYAHTSKVIDITKCITSAPIKTKRKHKKLNNIRDIIEALEYENLSADAFSQQTLTEAETKHLNAIKNDRHAITESLDKQPEVNTESPTKNLHNINKSNTVESVFNYTVNTTESLNNLEISSNVTKMSILPMFLEFLFHNKGDIKSKPQISVTNRTRKSPHIATMSDEKVSASIKELKQIDGETKTSYKPVVLFAASIYNKSDYEKNIPTSSSNEKIENLEANRLTIDLKGNIIATDTPCHAFVGTIFSNVIHHSEEETITDFIIAELTIFCKGLLSSCTGIDLLLL